MRIYTKTTRLGKKLQNRRITLKSWFDIVKQIEPYYDTGELASPCLQSGKKQVPENTVWQLWLQGEAQAPKLVQKCLRSVQFYTEGRPYVLLTEENLHEYLDMPDYIIQKYKDGKISNAHFSDIVRLMLLASYGGTWIDATVLLTSPIPKEIESSVFFAFKTADFLLLPAIPKTTETLYKLISVDNPPFPVPVLNPFHCCSNWFIHSSKNNPIILKTLSTLLAYWKKNDVAIDYFLFHYAVTLSILRDDVCRQIYAQMLSVGNYAPHMLQFSFKQDYDEEVYAEIKSQSFAHKLTHHPSPAEFASNSFYTKLLQS